MSTDPLVTCPRVTLRRLAPSDAESIAAYRAAPEVARFQSWETYSLAQARAMCEEQSAAAFGRMGTWFQFAIARTSDGVLIGDCGMHFPAGEPEQIEIGITLSAAEHGRGLASEAVGGVLDLAFHSLGMQRATARTDARNTPAAALFERLGFRREGHFLRCTRFKGDWCDEFLFAILRDEWIGSPQAGSAAVSGVRDWQREGGDSSQRR